MTPASRAAFAAGLAASLFAPAALAQALTAPNVGTSASGPVTEDLAAIHWNPAMLTHVDKPTTLLGLNLILGDIQYQRERRGTYQRDDSLQFAQPISPANVDPSKTGKAAPVRSTPFGPSPGLFGAAPVAKDLVAGFGVYVPYAAIVNFDENGPQRWALQSATIATIYFSPSIAYKLSDQLSAGLSVSYVLGIAQLDKIQDFAALDDVGRGLARKPIEQRNDFGREAPTGVRELSTMARPIKLKQMVGHGFTFNAGFAWAPAPSTKVGVSYQHTVKMSFNGKFSLDMNDDFFTQDLKSQGLAYKSVVEGDATLAFTLPRAVHAGISQKINDRWAAVLSGSYTWWSSVDTFDVRVRSPDLAQPKIGIPDTSQIQLPRHWKNTILVTGTLKWQTTPALRTWLLGGYHSSAVPDETIDAASPDGNAIIVAFGGGYALSKSTTFLADFKAQSILPRTVKSSKDDLGNGEYKLSIYALGLYLQSTFQ